MDAQKATYEELGVISWFEKLIKSELAPYPGRGAAVARMVIAATLTMLVIMTFRINGGALGAIYAFLISRQSMRSTLQSGLAIVISYSVGVLFVLCGAAIFADQQSARIIWFAGSMFVTFFVLRTLRQTEVATGFAVLVVNALPIWQIPQTAEYRVEQTLWLALAVAIGTAVTISVEVVFRSLWTRNEVVEGTRERLEAIRRLFSYAADGTSIPPTLLERAMRYSVVGTSGLRSALARSSHEGTAFDRWSTTIALVGRVVDAGVSVIVDSHLVGEREHENFRRFENDLRELLSSWGEMREHIIQVKSQTGRVASLSCIPQLSELHRSLSMLAQIRGGADVAAIQTPISDCYENTPSKRRCLGSARFSFFVPDAFQNREHLKFAVRGCLATTLCYLIYELLDWRTISTCITTCVLTALSTVGASRQKQILRVGGAIAGGVVVGIGSQIFILPAIDSIASFSILFALVTAAGAWIATSSSRLSYFGVQLALAFYLVNVQEFSIQTSLSVARDRVVGILLGLFMMWLAFDRIAGVTASDAMIRALCQSLRAMANIFQLATESDLPLATQRVCSLREQIRSSFDTIHAQADAILFEFGLDRTRGMIWRSRIRDWQPRLRTIYFREVALLEPRLLNADDSLPASFWKILGTEQCVYARSLVAMADHIEGRSALKVRDHFPEEVSHQLHETQGMVTLSPAQTARASQILESSRETQTDIEVLLHEVFDTAPYYALHASSEDR
jgi:multidrug resistance protein MdtO